LMNDLVADSWKELADVVSTRTAERLRKKGVI
jgi:hypothetical protein